MKRLMMTAAALFACCAVGCSGTQERDTDACCGACKRGEVCTEGCCAHGSACCGKCTGAEGHEHAEACPGCKDGKMCEGCKAAQS